ncbi:hypothetical protein SAMN02745121_00111 [Nannocystis exedens]|uniref:Uncharacterized protein n=2 Tax=Nannocystis exedens TaxID=54 RepID=A0A1I1SR61_9BACT|nr:hypothetical protein NAEX_08682 [Nannocystis exedens]SFD47218.1 hypothetical protein SAMN02745121_00111 [Nannocystis exedens]
MTLTFLMTSLLACGETGDTTTTSGTDATAGDDTTTTSGTDSTTSEPTTASEPTSGTEGASETGTTTGETTSVTTADTTDATTADTTGTTADTTGTTAVDTTGETTTDTTGETTDTTGDTEGTSPLVIAVVDAYLYADCMPVSEPDPVQGTWYVEFDNTDNPNDTAAVLTGASLSLESADPPVIEPIQVSPIESPPLPAGEYISVEMAKLPGMAHSACEHCDEFYTLVLEYDENGVKHHVAEAVTISCSF